MDDGPPPLARQSSQPQDSATSLLYPGYVPIVSRLRPYCISATSQLYLGYVPIVSRLRPYCISATPYVSRHLLLDGEAALLGDVALFDVGLFKPTCVASFGFARQLLLQLGVVVIGAFVVSVPIYARILTQLKKDAYYRSFARVKASITDFYKGDFGQEVFTRLGKIFHLVDVQWPLLAYKGLCAFRCDADGYLASSPSERCRVQNYVLGIICLLVFVVPVPSSWRSR